MSNVVKIDFRDINRSEKVKEYRRKYADWENSVRLLRLQDKIQPLIDRMMAIDKLEGLLLIEQILKPHRSIK